MTNGDFAVHVKDVIAWIQIDNFEISILLMHTHTNP